MKRFWDKVEKTKACWNWIAFRDWSGYGTIRFEGFTWKAHRLSWTMKNGKIPDGLIICHKCDNPACVRPSHLFMGTHRDNKLDCVAKNRCYRSGKPPMHLGENHPNRILNEAAIHHIRESYTGKYGDMTRLGRLYGVNRTTIYRVIKGDNWSHVKIPPNPN